MGNMNLVLSHSQISKLKCGRQFELAYIEGLARKEGLHSRNRNFGTAFHAGMQAVLTYQHESPYFYNIEVAVGVARRSAEEKLDEIAEANKDSAELEYIEMLGQLKHEVGVLLEWFVPRSGIGDRYHVATMHDIFESYHKCDECGGDGTYEEDCYSCSYGITEEDCDECWGSGMIEDEDGEEIDCPACDGDGYHEVDCDECDGSGYIESDCEECCGEGDIEDDTPLIEWAFDYALTETVTLRGFVDAVLFDKELGEFILVDWKTRASIGDATMSMLDAQLQLYAYVIEAMREDQGGYGNGIDKVRMMEVRTTPPAPAKINKNGTPSIAANAGSTTREAWLASLNEQQLEKYGNEEFISTVGSIRSLEYFARETDEYMTDSMRELTFQNIIAQAEQIAYWHGLHEEGKDLPAILTSYGCRGCDFLQLCANPFHNGTDATALIEADYDRKEGYQPDVAETEE